MWQEISSEVPDVESLRRLLFAASQLPKDTPKYYEIICKFAFAGKKSDATATKTRVLLENIEYINDRVFMSDKQLMRDLHAVKGLKSHPLGVVLISANSSCKLCHNDLIVRSDRPSFIVIYTDEMGTIPGTHFRKYCRNSRNGCSFTQHYGFHCESSEEDDGIRYDEDWFELPYFLSSSKTAFSMSLLRKYDTELLVSQVSYTERSDIYNLYHNYDQTKKKSSKAEKETSTAQPL